MSLMGTELADFIRFWRYDQSSANDAVPTNFFEVESTAAEVETYASYNATKTLPNCGTFNSEPRSCQFGQEEP